MIFAGAVWVGNALNVLAWIALVGGQLLAIGAAASYDCTETFIDSCDDAGSDAVLLYVSVAITTLLSALFMFAAGYGLLLLDRIERSSRATPK
jgi:hypothetical protein